MHKKQFHADKLESLREQGTLNPRPQDVRHPLFQDNEFFDARDLVQVKYEMLRQVQVEKVPASHSARTFGFSRPTLYQTQRAFEREGLSGLVPHKRGPRRGHKLTLAVMQFIAEIQTAYPSLHPRDLAQRVKEQFGLVVHPRSIERRLGQEKKRR
jgi:transposase